MNLTLKWLRFSTFAGLFLLAAQPAGAQNRFWGGSDASAGGNGTWTATSNTWATTDAAPYNVTTSSAVGHDNFFGGTAGVVTVDGTINFRSLVFATDGYSVVGGTNPLLQRNSDLVLRTTSAGVTATISGITFTKTDGSRGLLIGLSAGEPNVGTIALTNNTINSSIPYIELISGTLQLGDGNTFAGIGTEGVRMPSDTTSTLAFANTGTGPLFGNASRIINMGSGNYTLRSADTTARTIANGLSFTASSLNFGDATNNGKLTFTTASVSLGGVTKTFNVAANSEVEFTGAIGSGGLIKSGAGMLTLSGTNTYASGTTINAGTVRVTNTAGLGSGSVTFNTATLELLNNGGGSGETITYTHGSTTIPSGQTVTIHVGNHGANTNNTIAMSGGYTLGNSTLNVTGANGYSLSLPSLLVAGGGPGTATLNPTSANLILGTVNNTNANHTLELGGTSTGNQITGAIANSAATLSIAKINSGTWSLQGDNTYAGTTNVNAGTLLVNGTHNIAGAGVPGLYTVANGATLGGSGATEANVTVNTGGWLAPGTDTPGDLGTGNLLLSPGSTLAVNLDGVAAGVSYDQIDVLGTVTLTDALLDIDLGFSPRVGTMFTIIDNDLLDAVVGTFSGLPEGTVFSINNVDWHISYAGGTGNDVVLTVTPEPLSIALWSLAGGVVLVVGGWRRRRW